MTMPITLVGGCAIDRQAKRCAGVLRMSEMQEWERRDQRSGRARVWDWVRCLNVACVVG